MTSTLWILLAIAMLVILALAAYATLLWSRVFRLEREQKTRNDVQNAQLFESIRLIALAMQQGQCDLSEGSIRLTVLLDHLVLADNPDFPSRYPAIHDMHERIKHMPTHDARRTYPKETIEHLDEVREGYEVEMASDIQADIDRLLVWVRQQQP
jgi:hypothetical protein